MRHSSKKLSGKWIGISLVTLGYTLITVAMTYPVAFRLSSVLAGYEARDAFAHLWSLWWNKVALIDLHTSPANLTYLWHPGRPYHRALAVEPYTQLVSLPLVLALGPLLAYNVHFLLSFILTGLTTYLLGCQVTRYRPAAFIGGLIFAFFPNRMLRAPGHFILLTMYWVPLYTLFLFRLLGRPSRRNALLCGLFLALSLSVHPVHVGNLVIPITLAFLLYHYRAFPPGFRRRFLTALLLAGLLTAPFFVPFLVDQFQGRLDYLQSVGTVKNSVDPLAFFTPSRDHPLFQEVEAARAFLARVAPFTPPTLNGENVVYLGMVPLGLALWGLRGRPRRVGFWILLGLGGAVLSLGPFLKVEGDLVRYTVEGQSSYVVLPYALLDGLPFFQAARAPVRFIWITMLSLAVLVSHGTAALLRALRGRPARGAACVALALLIPLEYVVIFPFPTSGQVVPDFYRQLAQDPRDYALLDVPLGERFASHYAMYYQTIHGHRIVAGSIYRWPYSARRWVNFFEEAFDPRPRGEDIVPAVDDRDRLALLNRYDVKYVVLHQGALTEERRGLYLPFLRRLLGDPVYQDPRIAAFAVPEVEQELREMTLQPAMGNWHQVEEWEGMPSRWMSNDATLHAEVPAAGRYRLRFTAYPFGPRHLQVWVNEEPVGEFKVTGLQNHATAVFPLPAGLNVIRFHSRETCQVPREVLAEGDDPRCLSLLFREVRLLPTDAEAMQQSVGADLEGKVTLLGYDLEKEALRAGDDLSLTLYWQAQQAMNRDYTVFVHLVDEEGELVAQRDSQPLGGAYPTSRWAADEVVADQYRIPIPAETPSGEYQLKVGMYLPVTMERLWVVGDPSGENVVRLGTVRIAR